MPLLYPCAGLMGTPHIDPSPKHYQFTSQVPQTLKIKGAALPASGYVQGLSACKVLRHRRCSAQLPPPYNLRRSWDLGAALQHTAGSPALTVIGLRPRSCSAQLPTPFQTTLDGPETWIWCCICPPTRHDSRLSEIRGLGAAEKGCLASFPHNQHGCPSSQYAASHSCPNPPCPKEDWSGS